MESHVSVFSYGNNHFNWQSSYFIDTSAHEVPGLAAPSYEPFLPEHVFLVVHGRYIDGYMRLPWTIEPLENCVPHTGRGKNDTRTPLASRENGKLNKYNGLKRYECILFLNVVRINLHSSCSNLSYTCA